MLRRIVIWLLRCLAVVIFILTMGAAALWMMPRAVSTDWFRNQLETRASGALHRQVAVEGLRWTWKEGLQVQGLRIADDPAFGSDPIISLDTLKLEMDPGQLMDRRLYLDLRMEGLEARLIRGADGRTNVEAWLAQLAPARRPAPDTRPAEPRDWRKMALALPGDLTTHIQLDRGALLAVDRQAKRSLAVRDIALLVNIPSLVSKPVTVRLSATQAINGKPLPPVDLTLSVEHLVDATPAVQPGAASINLRCRFPGLDMAVSGGLSGMGIQGKMDLDLAALMEAAGPLIPPSFPAVSGRMDLSAKARLASGNEIAYDMTLAGSRLAVSGGPLKERRIGPVALQFSQTGRVSPERMELNIDRGELRVQEKSRLAWQGQVRQADAPGVEADLSMDAIAVDLHETAALAGPFIPMDFTTGWSPEHPQGLTVEQVRLKGILPDGTVHVTLKGLKVELPGLKPAPTKNGLTADGVHLRVPEADVLLQERFPTSLDIKAELGVRFLSLSGIRPVRLHGLKVLDVHVAARDLARSQKALPGVAGAVTLKESVLIEQIDAPGLAAVPRFRHDLQATVLSRGDPRSMKVSAQVSVEAPSMTIHDLSKHPVQGGVHLKAQIRALDIGGLNPLMADVEGLEAGVRVGRILDFHMNGQAQALGARALRVKGRMTLDLDGAGALVPASMKPKGTFTGALEVEGHAEGRRPTPAEVKTFSNRELSLGQRIEVLKFLDGGEVSARLRDVGVDFSMKKGSLSVRGIRSLSPLTLTAASGLTSVRLEGKLAFGGISQIPGIRAFDPPLSGTLSLKADGRDLTSFELTETLHMDPLKIDQDLRISLNRLGRLLNSRNQPGLSDCLRHMDATLTGSLRAAMGPALDRFTPGLTLRGSLKAGFGMELEGGKEISARASLESGGLNVIAGDHAEIRDLKADIKLQKTCSLQFQGETKPGYGAGPALLSRKVLRPSRGTARESVSGDVLTRRLMEDLGGRVAGRPAVSFDFARLKGGRLPLELRHGEMHFRLADSLPSIDRFQFETLGGAVLGDFRISRQDDPCRLELNGAFSGLDAAAFMPERMPADSASTGAAGEDTRLSGRVSLKMPVSRDPVQVMNNLSAGIRLTHIGSRTLERFLYAMDPYEANEGIVRQRALLRKGSPEWIDLEIRHGNLSLTGAVKAVGARLPLPPVERLNLTNLPIHSRLQNVLGRLGPVEKALKTLSAEAIMINKDSTIRFVENKP